jgi:hypothetical protein
VHPRMPASWRIVNRQQYKRLRSPNSPSHIDSSEPNVRKKEIEGTKSRLSQETQKPPSFEGRGKHRLLILYATYVPKLITLLRTRTRSTPSKGGFMGRFIETNQIRSFLAFKIPRASRSSRASIQTTIRKLPSSALKEVAGRRRGMTQGLVVVKTCDQIRTRKSNSKASNMHASRNSASVKHIAPLELLIPWRCSTRVHPFPSTPNNMKVLPNYRMLYDTSLRSPVRA